MGIHRTLFADGLEGNFIHVAGQILDAISANQNYFQALKPICLLFGGEPTVKVTGAGLGGEINI